jgi:hypothetical protein
MSQHAAPDALWQLTAHIEPSGVSVRSRTRTAIQAQLGACHGNVAACLAVVAQEAGDRPDLYAARMRGVRRSVAVAYLDAAAMRWPARAA